MRFIFKTDYEERHSASSRISGYVSFLRRVCSSCSRSHLMYYRAISSARLVFVCIYATVGVALLILTSFTGRASLGQ